MNDGDLWKLVKGSLERGDFTALEEMLASEGSSIIPILDSNHADQKYYDEALTWACFAGRTDIATELLDRSVDPATGIATGLAAFHWAANRGNIETVRLLIERGAPLEQKNMYDGTVLGCRLWSAVNEHRPEHAEIVEMLVEAGAEFDGKWLEWWNSQQPPTAVTKIRIAKALAR